MRIRPTAVLLFAALAGSCHAADTVTGIAKVVDGDSLEIGATRIRLHAVDAPEGRQTCTRNGATWRCGDEAAARLRALVGNSSLRCVQKDTDDYGRMVAVCTKGGVDVGAELVKSGLALAYRQYGNDYVAEENAARSARRGVWAGEFTPPWEWRRSQDTDRARTTPPSPSPTSSAPTGRCRIKGNINSEGERIYHTPQSPSYEATVVDERRGERWFCSEQEARNAGWRAPRG